MLLVSEGGRWLSNSPTSLWNINPSAPISLTSLTMSKELLERAQDAWAMITLDQIRDICGLMPDRLAEVIRNEGGHTEYEFTPCCLQPLLGVPLATITWISSYLFVKRVWGSRTSWIKHNTCAWYDTQLETRRSTCIKHSVLWNL